MFAFSTVVKRVGLQHRQHALSTLSSRSGSDNDYLKAALAALSLAATATTAVVSCEEEKEEELKPFVPYKNVPKEDAPTNCSICKKNRKGPCGEYWRSVEACLNDNDNEKIKANECSQYMLHFFRCQERHSTMCDLINIDDAQESFLREVEMEFNDRPVLESVGVDWQNWQNLIADKGSYEQALKDVANWKSLDKTVPYWKRFEILKITHPKSIPLYPEVPTTMTVKNSKEPLILRAVWAVDENGVAIGYNDTLGKDIEKLTVFSVTVHAFPGMIDNFRVLTLYSGKAKDENEETLQILLESRPISMSEAAAKSK